MQPHATTYDFDNMQPHANPKSRHRQSHYATMYASRPTTSSCLLHRSMIHEGGEHICSIQSCHKDKHFEALQTLVAAKSLRAVARVLIAVALGRLILVGPAQHENFSIISTRVALPSVRHIVTSGHYVQHIPSFNQNGLECVIIAITSPSFLLLSLHALRFPKYQCLHLGSQRNSCKSQCLHVISNAYLKS